MRWTKAYRKSHGKEMIVDSTFEFEKRRNEPQKYNREVMVQTVQAMKKVSEIKQRREREFFKARMRKTKARENDFIQNELGKHITLVSEPKVKEAVKERMLEKEMLAEEKKLKYKMGRKKPIDTETIETMQVE